MKKKKEIKINITLRPFTPSAEHERLKARVADHIIEFVYKHLEKKFPEEKNGDIKLHNAN